MSTYHEDVDFNTLDGLILRGWLYPASARGPAVIMTPGVSPLHREISALLLETFMP